MANVDSPPLYERIPLKSTVQRALDIIIFFLLLSLLVYRLLSLNDHGFTWLFALLCESWFTFIWVLLIGTKWTPVEYKTYPDHLLQRVPELPPVDMFVTTADPVLEPPIITVNTVISLLAVDYPANKLACYVSDDACSPLTFYSLVQASKFAKLWVPFCKKYSVHPRAPFRYFDCKSEFSGENSSEFKEEWKKMKEDYDKLSQKIEAAQKSMPCELTGDFAAFSNIERSNHPSIIKVILENKEGLRDGLPHLVYISREKRPKHPHHFKAGAMNVLIVLQGMAGIQGPVYGGTGSFHRRKIIYGLSPEEAEINGGNLTVINGKFTDHKRLGKRFGKSMELTESAAQNLAGLKMKTDRPHDLSSSLDAAHHVAGCGYEYGTSWGTEVGWVYGSTTEDCLTGLKIHARGWKSSYCTPDPPAFLGCAPTGGPASMTQQKRWATGLLEILFSKNNAFIATLTAKLQFRQSLAYMWFLVWGIRSIPELCYAVLPAYCIFTNSNFLPKVEENAIFIPVALFVIYNLYTLSEYLQADLSIRSWWNNQRMVRIMATNAWLFGALRAILKLLGLSETVFEVTQKDQSSSGDGEAIDAGRFTFNESPIFIPGTTLVLVHFISLVIGLLRFQSLTHLGNGSGIGEFFCSVWVVVIFWPFVKGLFGKGEYGIPLSIICKSAALALLFLGQLCIGTSIG